MLVAETQPIVDDPNQPRPPASVPPAWKAIVSPIEPFLNLVARRLDEQVQAFDAEVVPFARYAISSQGKQLRPTLVALSGSAVGKINENLVNVAVIIEMVHLATLVHDDIMDSASIRRRRPTLAANWGNQISVLLGDCLFAHAVRMASSFPTPEVCRAVASATNTVCSGEILQTLHRGEMRFNRAEYFKVIEMKTGELFALSCDLGSWLGGANPQQREWLRQYGMALGTAYQVYDDCLDLFGSESRAGKSLGTDLASGKYTLPILVARERAGAGDAEEIQMLLKTWDRSHLPRLLALLHHYEALEESQAVIQQYLNKAGGLLSDLPDTPGRQALEGLTGFLAQQTGTLGCST